MTNLMDNGYCGVAFVVPLNMSAQQVIGTDFATKCFRDISTDTPDYPQWVLNRYAISIQYHLLQRADQEGIVSSTLGQTSNFATLRKEVPKLFRETLGKF